MLITNLCGRRSGVGLLIPGGKRGRRVKSFLPKAPAAHPLRDKNDRRKKCQRFPLQSRASERWRRRSENSNYIEWAMGLKGNLWLASKVVRLCGLKDVLGCNCHRTYPQHAVRERMCMNFTFFPPSDAALENLIFFMLRPGCDVLVRRAVVVSFIRHTRNLISPCMVINSNSFFFFFSSVVCEEPIAIHVSLTARYCSPIWALLRALITSLNSIDWSLFFVLLSPHTRPDTAVVWSAGRPENPLRKKRNESATSMHCALISSIFAVFIQFMQISFRVFFPCRLLLDAACTIFFF